MEREDATTLSERLDPPYSGERRHQQYTQFGCLVQSSRVFRDRSACDPKQAFNARHQPRAADIGARRMAASTEVRRDEARHTRHDDIFGMALGDAQYHITRVESP